MAGARPRACRGAAGEVKGRVSATRPAGAADLVLVRRESEGILNCQNRGFIFADKTEAWNQNAPMSSQATGLRVASVIFALFAIGHLVRLVNQAEVTVATYQVPMWVSVVALIIAAILSIWMWRLSSVRR
jgi:Flp pilus assembly protein TadB